MKHTIKWEERERERERDNTQTTPGWYTAGLEGKRQRETKRDSWRETRREEGLDAFLR